MISVTQISRLYAALLDSEAAKNISLDFAVTSEGNGASETRQGRENDASRQTQNQPLQSLTRSFDQPARLQNTQLVSQGLPLPSAQSSTSTSQISAALTAVLTNALSGTNPNTSPNPTASAPSVATTGVPTTQAATTTGPSVIPGNTPSQPANAASLAALRSASITNPSTSSASNTVQTPLPGALPPSSIDAGLRTTPPPSAAQPALSGDLRAGQDPQSTISNARSTQSPARTGIDDGSNPQSNARLNSAVSSQHPGGKQAFSTSLPTQGIDLASITASTVEKAFAQTNAGLSLQVDALRNAVASGDAGLPANFAEFIETAVQNGGARDAGGLLSLVALNAAFLPGWPTPQPFTPVPPKNIEKLRQALSDGEIKDEAKAMEYLASLGFNKALMEKIQAALQKVDDKVKFLIWLTTIATVMTRILKTLSREVVDPTIDYEDELEDQTGTPDRPKPRKKRRVLKM